MNEQIEIRACDDADTADVVALWRRCGLEHPGNDSRAMIARKLNVQPELFLVATCAGRVAGTVMAGDEGRRGWINLLAVDPAFRRRGIGRRLMDSAEALLRARGCPKINLQIRATNVEAVAFYERLGYLEDRVRSFGKRLE